MSGIGQSFRESRLWAVVRWPIAIFVVAGGLIVPAYGACLETRNPRSNEEDNRALCVLALGSAILSAGLSIPTGRLLIVILVAVASPFVAYALVLFVVWAAIVINAALVDVFGVHII